MSTMWAQSLPVGVLRSLQDPTMMLREVHKIPTWRLQGPKMSKIWHSGPLNTNSTEQNTQNLTPLGHHLVN